MKPVFKVHCSSIGDLMTNPKEKSPLDKYNECIDSIKEYQSKYDIASNKNSKTAQKLLSKISGLKKDLEKLESDKGKIHLSATAKSVAKKWMKFQIYKKVHEINTKEIEKGKHCEVESIVYANKVYGYDGAKNLETKENDFLIGTCDVNLKDTHNLITDIKNSWSEQTFPLFEKECPEKDYPQQGQGYMELWDADNFSVIYTLMDAPEHIIEREAKKKYGFYDLEFEHYEEMRELLTYSNLPDFLRIKRFDFVRDREFIKSVNERVLLVRKWIENETDFYNIYEKTIL